MAPGALGEQFNHPADIRIALNQDDIPFAYDSVEVVHVVYHGLFIIPAGRLKTSQDTVSQELNELLYFFHA
jgi:hypothetical protein